MKMIRSLIGKLVGAKPVRVNDRDTRVAKALDALPVNASQVHRDLVVMRALLARPENWIQGPYAQDINGWVASSHEDSAFSWCMAGAMYRAVGTGDSRWARSIAISKAITGYDNSGELIWFSETPGRTFDEVAAKLDAAIAETAPSEVVA